MTVSKGWRSRIEIVFTKKINEGGKFKGLCFNSKEYVYVLIIMSLWLIGVKRVSSTRK